MALLAVTTWSPQTPKPVPPGDTGCNYREHVCFQQEVRVTKRKARRRRRKVKSVLSFNSHATAWVDSPLQVFELNVGHDLPLTQFAASNLTKQQAHDKSVDHTLSLCSVANVDSMDTLSLAAALAADWGKVKKFKTNVSKWQTWLQDYFESI